ncbi:MAG: tetratricopeptide repeat protein [Elusimicrobiota bacterium]
MRGGLRWAGRWENIATAALLACVGIQLLSRFSKIAEMAPDAFCRQESDFHIEGGEALLHGVPWPGVARAMPAYSVTNAFLYNHLPRAASSWVHVAALLACVTLVFALGAFLYSGICGAGAAFLYALMPHGSEVEERWLYTMAVLIAAYFLARRARAPSLRASAWLAAAIGGSLLILSPLFLFPALLVSYEWARDWRRGPSRRWEAAALCALPLIFLAPWIIMNWRLSGRLVILEDGRAENNIITGALGLVRTLGMADSRAIADIPPGHSALLWAAGEVLLHPMRYLAAVWGRVVYAAGLHPLLVLAAAASAWLSRKREDCRQLQLLAGYFIAIHCLMSVQENYFAPAWPILAVLTAGLFAGWTKPASKRLQGASEAAVYMVFGLLLLVQGGTLALVWSYPGRAAAPQAWERELSSHPKDPWLWSERGMRRLRAGQAAAASGDLARAFSLNPQRDQEIRYAWALLARGGLAARIWERPGSGRSGTTMDFRERILKAVYLGLNGRPREAGKVMEEVKKLADVSGANGTTLAPIILEIISSWPAATRPTVIALFENLAAFRSKIDQESLAEAWLDVVRLNLAAGDLQSAFTHAGYALVLGRSATTKPPPREPGPLDLLRKDEGSLLFDRAEASLDGGDRTSALTHLARALKKSLSDEQFRHGVLLYQRIGEYALALEVVERRLQIRPDDARWRNDRGTLHSLMGRRKEAIADWNSAIALNRDLLAPYFSLGSLYVSLNQRQEARDLFQRALLRRPGKEESEAAKLILAEWMKLLPARGSDRHRQTWQARPAP